MHTYTCIHTCIRQLNLHPSHIRQEKRDALVIGSAFVVPTPLHTETRRPAQQQPAGIYGEAVLVLRLGNHPPHSMVAAVGLEYLVQTWVVFRVCG